MRAFFLALLGLLTFVGTICFYAIISLAVAAPLKVHKYEAFNRTTVKLDSNDFEHCTFVDATFIYDGGDYVMNDERIVGNVYLVTHSPAVDGAMRFQHKIGILRAATVVGNWGDPRVRKAKR